MTRKTDPQQLLVRVNTPVYALAGKNGPVFSDTPGSDPDAVLAQAPAVPLENLGDPAFRQRHRLRCNYVAGAMANGICSTAMVKAMARNGMLAFFGAGGLSLDEIETAIRDLKSDLGDLPYGFNLIHSLSDPAHEMATVEMYLKHGIRLVSAAAFMRMTEALVYYRVKGIHEDPSGSIITPNQIKAKVSRVEVASQFFSPPPEKLVDRLVARGLITPREAALSRHVPMAQDLTAEADSGGHTDNRPALALLPTMLALKAQFQSQYSYDHPLCVGLGGGIATPESAAAAFSMGAAYVLTGSVNQSCVEAGICDHVKAMLCQSQQADVAMAPAADMFEIGARVQVLKRGSLFPIRAEKLYRFYQAYNGFEALPEAARREVEEKILQQDFNLAWQSTRRFFLDTGNPGEVEKAEQDPRHKMALVFRSYLGLSSKWAIQGLEARKMDYQIWCGPAMGAFNQWVTGSVLEPPENREVALVAKNLMLGAAVVTRAGILRVQGIDLPHDAAAFSPLTESGLASLI